MAENPFTKLSLAGQLGVAVVSAGLIGGVFYCFCYRRHPAGGEQDGAARVAAEGDPRPRGHREQASGIPARSPAPENKLETLKQILPPEQGDAGPHEQGPVAGRRSRTSASEKFTARGHTVTKDFYQEWPISMDVERDLPQPGVFFERVGRLSRLVNLGKLKVGATPRPDGLHTINATCVAHLRLRGGRLRPAKGAPQRPSE